MNQHSYNPDPVSRFFSKVEFIPFHSCLEWVGRKNVNGYGTFFNKGSSYLAHRFSYLLERGPIPPGLELDHLCRNRGCVNPFHLEPVTHYENIRRSFMVTKTHCKKGHPLFGENLRLRLRHGTNYRVCRTCEGWLGLGYDNEINRKGLL